MLNKSPIIIKKRVAGQIDTLPPKATQILNLLIDTNKQLDTNLFDIDQIIQGHNMLINLKSNIEASGQLTEGELDGHVYRCLTIIEEAFAANSLYLYFLMNLVDQTHNALTDILFPQCIPDYTYTPPQKDSDIDRVQEGTATDCGKCLALEEPNIYEFKKLLSKITGNYAAMFKKSTLRKLLRSFDQISVTEAESHSRTKGSHNSIRGEIDTSYANSTLGDDGLYIKNFLTQTFENNFNENTKAALGDEIYLKLYQEFIAALKKRYPKAFN